MKFKSLFSAFLLGLVQPSFAEESKYTLIKRIDLTYFGFLDGPAVFNSIENVPDKYGNPNPHRPMSLTNFVTLGYKVTPDVTLGVLNTFQYLPFSNNGFNLLDPAVSLTHHGLFKSDNLETFFDVRVFLPLTEASMAAKMATAIQSFQLMEYRFQKSQWSMGSMSMMKVGFFGASEELVQDFSFSVGPNLNYYLTEKMTLSLFTGASLNHYQNGDSTSFVLEDEYLGPGVTFTIADDFTVSPILTVPPSNPMLRNVSFLLFVFYRSPS